MNLNIAYPSISEGTTEERLNELKSYLYQMVETLNACDTSAYAVMSELSQAVNASELPDDAKRPETELRLQEYSALRSLIIKTADYAVRNSESFGLSLQGNYVAVSDFGKYFENATVDIDGTPYGITQLYNYSAGIDAANADYRVNQESYIKTGLLYHDEATPVYGVGVGNIYGDFSVYEKTEDTEINNAKTYYTKNGSNYVEVSEPTKEDLTTYFERVLSRQGTQLYSTFTADEMAFWSGSTKLAYMHTGAVYFPNAHMTGGSIQIGGTDSSPTFSVNTSGYMKATSGKIANWNIGTDNLYTDGATYGNTTGAYFGTSGLRIGANLKATSDGKITAINADLSGKVTATSGSIGGWTIGTNQLYSGNVYLNGNTGTISGASISGGYISGSSISGGSISAATLYGSSSGGVLRLDGTLEVIGAGDLGYYVTSQGAGVGFWVSGTAVYAVSSGAAMQSGSAKISASSNGAISLSASYIEASVSITVPSDVDVKHDISYDLDKYEDMYNALLPCTFKYNNGTSDRDHWGFIAQDFKGALIDNGLTTQEAAAYVEHEDIGNGSCGIRYSEFISLNTWQIQKLKKRVEALEQMIGG